jgi:hypothetical protein
MTNTSPGHPAGGPKSRRTFTPAQKLDLLAGCEDEVLRNEGGAYLRKEGIYSSQMTESRKLRDAGVLTGRNPGEKIGRLTPEQAEPAEHDVAVTAFDDVAVPVGGGVEGGGRSAAWPAPFRWVFLSSGTG